ncbi:hypothetical protein LC092_20990 [Stappia stellulata]|uniref:hypothetical protein n=1 Tax=Stappia stellulata TaxID=71235 RepID=UPI001CD26157|nr:hypothetical protein [Stappia stellulata]MCA1244923.1 hypothetical protein [Stappia stellulata]
MISLIFDTIEPYVYEALPIMFLPRGFEYEARFKEKHVEDGILETVRNSSSVKVFGGVKVLISLRTKISKEAQDGDYQKKLFKHFHCLNSEGKRLISPIRFAEIISIKLMSGFVLIRYRLCDYFCFQSPLKLSEVLMQREDLNRLLYEGVKSRDEYDDLPHLAKCTNEKLEDLDRQKQPFHDSDWGAIDRGQLDAWGGVASQFAFLPHIHDLPFVMFAAIRKLALGPNPHREGLQEAPVANGINNARAETVPNTGDGRLKLRSRMSYELKVFECYPHELINVGHDIMAPVTTKTPDEDHSRGYRLSLDDNFFLKESDQSAIGGYDFLEFPLATRPSTNGSRGVLGLSLPELSGHNRRRFISKKLVLEYEVELGWLGWSMPAGLAAMVLLAVGTGLNGPEHLADGMVGLLGVSKEFANIVVSFLQTAILAMGIVGVVSYLVTQKQ